MYPNQKSAFKKLLQNLLLLGLLALIVGLLVWWRRDHSSWTPNPTINTHKSAAVKASFNKQQYSLSDPTSLWVIVNKGRVLPSTYVPPDLVVPSVKNHYGDASNDSHLRAAAANSLEQMFADAKNSSLSLVLYSGYRSYSEQSSINDNFAANQGRSVADQSSAHPGHSEHQTGRAADISAVSGKCDIDACFGDTPEGKWLADNSYKYGFIIRYQKDTQQLTGYVYEPWHVRYVGTALAAQVQKAGQTLEQFFELPTYTDYPASSIQLGSP